MFFATHAIAPLSFLMHTIDMQVSLLAPALWIICLIMFLVSGGFGVIFAYHWVRFSPSHAVTTISIVGYAVGAVTLLGIMFISVGALMFV